MSVFIEKSDNTLVRFAADSRAEMIHFATDHGINAIPYYQPEGYFEIVDGTLKKKLTADPLIDKVTRFEFILRLKTISA